MFQRKRGNFEGLKNRVFREKGGVLSAESQRKGVVLGIEER